jgi:hypothetical protein
MTIKKMEKMWKDVVAGVFIYARKVSPPIPTTSDSSVPVMTKATEWRRVHMEPHFYDLLSTEEGSGFGPATKG